jgi:hypothetical protein
MRFSESTKNREPYTKVWQAAINEGSMFAKVKNRDVFISETFNDAYDINAGDFFARSSIRLAGIVPPSYLWSNYEECRGIKLDRCLLTEYIDKARITIGNGARGVMLGDSTGATYPTNYGILNLVRIIDEIRNVVMKKDKPKNVLVDWQSEMSEPGILEKSNFWYFNLFMLTPEIGVIYLIKFRKESSLKLDFNDSKIYQVSFNQKENYKLSLNQQCLESKMPISEIFTDHGIAYVSKWKLNSISSSSFSVTDPRDIEWGVC